MTKSCVNRFFLNNLNNYYQFLLLTTVRENINEDLLL